MDKTKFKIGDVVEIIPSKNHESFLKKYYGTLLTISNVVFTTKGKPLYKCDGVPGYALESDLKHFDL